MWDLPGPGLEPVSPALAGRFLTTVQPGKFPRVILLISRLIPTLLKWAECVPDWWIWDQKWGSSAWSCPPALLLGIWTWFTPPWLNLYSNMQEESRSSINVRIRSYYHCYYFLLCFIFTWIFFLHSVGPLENKTWAITLGLSFLVCVYNKGVVSHVRELK